MLKTKYITWVVKNNPNNEMCILFPDETSHSDMAKTLGIVNNDHTILGAGFVDVAANDGDIYYVCSGNSVSLGVVGRPLDDSCLINIKMLGIDALTAFLDTK